MMTSLLYDIGINDSDYTVKYMSSTYLNGKRKRKLEWSCPYYVRWTDMLKRCYSDKFVQNNPTYLGCTVSEEWLTFSNFRLWVVSEEKRIGSLVGLQLDKDLLVPFNKVYSKDTCVFVHNKVNTFSNDGGSARGEFLIGVHWFKKDKKFQSRCRNPFTKKREHLGYFTDEKEAHEVWRKRKEQLSIKLANSVYVNDERVRLSLINKYKIDSTDKDNAFEELLEQTIEDLQTTFSENVDYEYPAGREAGISVWCTGEAALREVLINFANAKVVIDEEGEGSNEIKHNRHPCRI